MNPMTIYLAGPMRGYPLFNFPAFFAAAEVLQGKGHEVHNPAAHDMANGFDPSKPLDDAYNEATFSLAEAFKWDFARINESDAIVLLPGWEKSKGAQAEVVLAMALGLEIWLWRDGQGAGGYAEPAEFDEYTVRFSTPAERDLIEECGHHGSSVYDPEGGQDVPVDPFALTDDQRKLVDKAFEVYGREGTGLGRARS